MEIREARVGRIVKIVSNREVVNEMEWKIKKVDESEIRQGDRAHWAETKDETTRGPDRESKFNQNSSSRDRSKTRIISLQGIVKPIRTYDYIDQPSSQRHH